jgi:hypothetical protein
MSNLTLPTMSLTALDRLMGKRTGMTLAYATTAVRTWEGIAIEHHGNRIALIRPDYIYVSNAGYGSSTTRTRLNRILRDNDIPYGVTQKDFAQYLVDDATRTRVPFTGTHTFVKMAEGWI